MPINKSDRSVFKIAKNFYQKCVDPGKKIMLSRSLCSGYERAFIACCFKFYDYQVNISNPQNTSKDTENRK